MNDFKDMLVYLRKRQGLSQQDLAERVGLTKSAISMYEQGARKPSYEMLEALADYFNVDIDFLTGRDATQSGPSPRAYNVAIAYDSLDAYGRAVVDAILSLEAQRMEEQNEKKD
jgi:transcriptional regulator with XRE-family HTH domain